MEMNTYLVDGVSGLGVHNGVVRLQFMSLNINGGAIDTLQIQIPLSAVYSVVEALNKVVLPEKEKSSTPQKRENFPKR